MELIQIQIQDPNQRKELQEALLKIAESVLARKLGERLKP